MSLYELPVLWKYATENIDTLRPSYCEVKIKSFFSFFFILNILQLSLHPSHIRRYWKCERKNIPVRMAGG